VLPPPDAAAAGVVAELHFTTMEPSIEIDCLGGERSPSVLGGAGLEAVLELAGNGAEVTGAASADGLSPLGLLGPVVCIPPCQYATLTSPSLRASRSIQTYTCGSWQQGNRTKRRPSSGCGANGV